MTKRKSSDERREFILQWIKESEIALTGQEIAEKTNVSRQIIVQDISLLKARNEPIIATSQGYIYINDKHSTNSFKKIIACYHSSEKAKDELLIMADYGIFVRDVIVEHAIYGEITASLMLKNRKDVDNFIKKMETTNAAYLSDLTDGVHLHTIEAETEEQLEEVSVALENAGFLLSKHE